MAAWVFQMLIQTINLNTHLSNVTTITRNVPVQGKNWPTSQLEDAPVTRIKRVTLKLGTTPAESLEGGLVKERQSKPKNSTANKHPQSHMTSDVIAQTDPKNQATSDTSDQNLMQRVKS